MEALIALVIAGILGMLVIAVLAGQREQDEWVTWSAQHNCKVVARREGQTSTGIAPIIGGKGGVAVTTSTTSDQTAYLCDDGVTYWKNE